MKNSAATARKWTEFVAARQEFPHGARILAAFEAGRITRLCECGCNSFDIEVANGANVEPLTAPDGGGCVFTLEFRTAEINTTLSFCVFVDAKGLFSGIDVDYCANSFPVPDKVELMEPPFHFHSSSSLLLDR